MIDSKNYVLIYIYILKEDGNRRCGSIICSLLVAELGPQQIPDLDLRDVVDYELVVEKCASYFVRRLTRTHGDNNSIGQLYSVGWVGSCPSEALGGMFSWGQVASVVVSLILFIDFSESDFAEQKDSGVVLT
jgi:hypothetical protein